MNNVAIILDESGSMDDIRQGTIQCANGIIASLKRESKKHNQETNLTFVKFANRVDIIYEDKPIEEANDINQYYHPNGLTSLFDAVGITIDRISKKKGTFLLLVVTDGYENFSKKYSSVKLKNLIKKVHRTNNWTITFQVPDDKSKENLVRFGIPSDNIRKWEATKQGVKTVEQTTSQSLTRYYKARQQNKTSVTNFYVTTDLSKVTKNDINTLEDLSNKFRVLTTSKEEIIKPFVVAKTKSYTKGCAYYQLTKKEKVHHHKQILVMDKTKKTIYGGEAARSLIGLPTSIDSYVNPGNHSNYDIFIQSTSVNRKLVRGTKVLVRK